MRKALFYAATLAAIALPSLTSFATFAYLNVTNRADTITLAAELPRKTGKVTVYDVVHVGPGEELPPPIGTLEYFERSINWNASIPNAHYNLRPYTSEEHVCMAKNIYFESRNESLRGQLAVALVTLERVADPRYPSDVCDVIYENKQFSWYWDGLSDYPRNRVAFEKAVLLASAAMSVDSAFYDYTYDSTHYHADYVQPYWAGYLVRKTKIETHIFYREEPETVASL